MRKIFLFLFAAVLSIGTSWAATEITLDDLEWILDIDGSAIAESTWNGHPISLTIYSLNTDLAGGVEEHEIFIRIGDVDTEIIDMIEGFANVFHNNTIGFTEITGTVTGVFEPIEEYTLRCAGMLQTLTATEYSFEESDLQCFVNDEGNLVMKGNKVNAEVYGFDATATEVQTYEAMVQLADRSAYGYGYAMVLVDGNNITFFAENLEGAVIKDYSPALFVEVSLTGKILTAEDVVNVTSTNLQTIEDASAKTMTLKGSGDHIILGNLSFNLILSNYNGANGTYNLAAESTTEYQYRGWMTNYAPITGSLTKSFDSSLNTNVYSGTVVTTIDEVAYTINLTMYFQEPEAIDITINNATLTWSGNNLELATQWKTYPVALTLYSYEAGAEVGYLEITVGDFDSEDNWYGILYNDYQYPLTVNENNHILTISGYFLYMETELYKVTISGKMPIDYTRSASGFGTICLPYGGEVKGATLWEFVQAVQDENGNITKVLLGSVDKLQAGVPYIFETSSQIAVYRDATVADEAGVSNGLHGTFEDNTPVAAGQYILSGGALCEVLADNAVTVDANRAYVVLSEVPTATVEQVPGRRYIGMGVQGENGATGLDQIVAPEGQTVKAIVNGQLVIIRGGEKFNAQGQKL